jgi:HEPN domain-containing protein
MSAGTHRREVDALRRRAYDFLIEAKEALAKERYDLSCFFSEQAVQLYVKSVLLEKVGDYPRLHHIRVLLSELAKYASSKELEGFLRDNRIGISSLEDAYLLSRYTSKTYVKEDAEDMAGLAETVISTVKKALGVSQ